MSYVYRRPWDYAVRQKAQERRKGARPQGKTVTSVTPNYPDFVPHFEKTKNHTNRRLLVPVLRNFPEPPTQTRSSGFLAKPFVRTAKRRKMPQQAFVPPTSPTQNTAAVPPAYFPVKQHTRHSHRTLRTLVEVNWVDKAAPTGSGYADASEFSYQGSTNRKFQVAPPPLGAWPATVETTEPATILLQKALRVEFERKALRVPELDYRPVQAASVASLGAFAPAPRVNRRKRGPITFETTGVIRDNRSPATPSSFLITPFKSIRRHTPRKLQKLPELNEYTATPSSDWRTYRNLPPVITRTIRSRQFQTVAPVAEFLRPKFHGPDLNRPVFVRTRATERKLLREQPIAVFPETPLPVIEYPSGFKAQTFRFRKSLGRSLQRLPGSIYTGYPTVLDQGIPVYLQSSIRDNTTYLESGMSDAVYLESSMSDEVYLQSSLNDEDKYLDSGMSDTVYLE